MGKVKKIADTASEVSVLMVGHLLSHVQWLPKMQTK